MCKIWGKSEGVGFRDLLTWRGMTEKIFVFIWTFWCLFAQKNIRNMITEAKFHGGIARKFRKFTKLVLFNSFIYGTNHSTNHRNMIRFVTLFCIIVIIGEFSNFFLTRGIVFSSKLYFGNHILNTFFQVHTKSLPKQICATLLSYNV